MLHAHQYDEDADLLTHDVSIAETLLEHAHILQGKKKLVQQLSPVAATGQPYEVHSTNMSNYYIEHASPHLYLD